jgi:hypothetical protein
MSRIHRLGVVLAAATLTLGFGGVAEAKPRNVQPRADVAALCTKYGGTAHSGPGAWWCTLPDGRTLWCFPDGWCTWTRTGGDSGPILPPTEGVHDDPTTSPTPTLQPTSGVG